MTHRERRSGFIMGSGSARPVQQEAELEGAPRDLATLNWGNSRSRALVAIGVKTLMMGLVNANAASPAVKPVVFGVALIFGGLVQLLAGLIQFRRGNAFTGVLFTGFGGFSMAFFVGAGWL